MKCQVVQQCHAGPCRDAVLHVYLLCSTCMETSREASRAATVQHASSHSTARKACTHLLHVKEHVHGAALLKLALVGVLQGGQEAREEQVGWGE